MSVAGRFALHVVQSVVLCAALFTGGVHAHDSRPIFVQIEHSDQGQTLLSWKIPDSVQVADAPDVVLTGSCRAARDPEQRGETGANRSDRSMSKSLQGIRWYACDADDSAQRVMLIFPGSAPSLATLVRVQWPDGSTQTRHAAPGELQILVPVRASTGGVLRHYFALGVEHILQGYDHLLFVVCLVLLAGSLRRTTLAVTGFTVSHSMTLGASAMGYVTVPVPPVEAAIALSIVFLAAELARARRDTLTWRHPVVVAGLFGLLHGFGFAAVLTEVGLPHNESLVALLGFNLGVEAGQLVFVLVLMLGLGVLTRFRADSVKTEVFPRLAAYPIGALAMFWVMERLVMFA